MRFFKVLMPLLKREKKHKKEGVLKKNILYAQEISMLFAGAGALFLTIALLTYDPADNSFFQYATNRQFTANQAGYLGAQAAALLFFLWGKSSYLFLGFIWSLVGFFWMPKFFFWERMAALTMFPALGATLLDAYQNSSWLPYTPTLTHQGGWIGMMLWRMLQHVFGPLGGFVLVYALLWVCLLWIAHYSLSTVAFAAVKHLLHVVQLGFSYSFMGVRWFFTTKVAQWMSSFREISWHAIEVHDDVVQHDSAQPIVFTAATLGTYQESQEAIKHKVWDELVALCSNVNKGSRPEVAPREHSEIEKLNQVFQVDQNLPLKPLLFSFDLLSSVASRLRGNLVSFGRWNVMRMRNSSIDLQKKTERLTALFKPASLTQEMITLTPKAMPQQSVQTTISQFVQQQTPFKLPSIKILETKQGVLKEAHFFEKELADRGLSLTEKLKHFGIEGKVTAIRPGPVITCFEYAPQADSKISKITALEDDLAMALCALSIRIVAPIPGRNVIGFEIANEQRSSVYLKEIANSDAFSKTAARLPLMMGVDTTGAAVVEDLVTMPHLLVAGSTGSGKSVGMHSMLTSLLFCKTPDELKLVLIDPKRLEFVAYADIPHLLFPIITQPNYAAPVLKWVVTEMERRYDTLARTGVRNIFDYQTLQKNSDTMAALPFIVVMIDELADLMMVAGKEVEMNIARIAQMARAAGIYMIVATQRPSVDVVTGLIKANFPSRIAFRVASKIDSRTILDSSGAEKLLGMGDMLFMHSSSSSLRRIHGAYVSEKEVLALTEQLRAQCKPKYISLDEVVKKNSGRLSDDEDDALFEEVCDFVQSMEEISISMLQRHYRIGFNRSARLIEQLESRGMIAPAQGSKPRKVIR